MYASLRYGRETKRLPYGVVVAVSQRVNVIWTVEDTGPYNNITYPLKKFSSEGVQGERTFFKRFSPPAISFN